MRRYFKDAHDSHYNILINFIWTKQVLFNNLKKKNYHVEVEKKHIYLKLPYHLTTYHNVTMGSPLSSSPSSASSASELSSGSISKTGDESQSSLSVGVEGAVSSVRTIAF